ncbi:hypothetical protein J3998_01180 [Thiomicrorhabdus sp. 6S2-11]|uniref:Methyltransferase type 11 domain-containing protein n=1 Tax=Thiomicrorhabdus marina TaxID=2818442 RepID=A0ABS3Q1I9_9GAMM|nr:hypothetical protein [Thiomicrorhabdus marina]MBO1926175.1 hypothetical protein [Thiomicrorhabdus marina]
MAGDAAEMGAGYGTFTLDIEPELCAQLPMSVAKKDQCRLKTHCQDILDLSEQKWLPLKPESLSFITVFNLLHFSDPIPWLSHLHNLLVEDGKLLIIHWRSDIQTPRGPDMALRPSSESIQAWCKTAGFYTTVVIDISDSCPWHYAVNAYK